MDSSTPKGIPAPKDQHLRYMADCIRALAMDAVEKAKSGHPGMPMGMADIATVLFTALFKGAEFMAAARIGVGWTMFASAGVTASWAILSCAVLLSQVRREAIEAMPRKTGMASTSPGVTMAAWENTR